MKRITTRPENLLTTRNTLCSLIFMSFLVACDKPMDNQPKLPPEIALETEPAKQTDQVAPFTRPLSFNRSVKWASEETDIRQLLEESNIDGIIARYFHSSDIDKDDQFINMLRLNMRAIIDSQIKDISILEIPAARDNQSTSDQYSSSTSTSQLERTHLLVVKLSQEPGSTMPSEIRLLMKEENNKLAFVKPKM